MNLTRRGFMKLLGASAGAAAVGLPVFGDKFEIINQQERWVHDKGDYLIVRVPDFKTFANEVFEKPVLFLMGKESSVSGVICKGFANIYGSNQFLFKDCLFDSRGKNFEGRRKGVVSVESGRACIISSAFYIGPGMETCLDLRGSEPHALTGIYFETSNTEKPAYNISMQGV